MRDEIDLRNIWGELSRRRMSVLAITGVCLLLGIGYHAARSRAFEGSAALQLGRVGRFDPSTAQARQVVEGPVWPRVLAEQHATATDLRQVVLEPAERGSSGARYVVLRVFAGSEEQARAAIDALAKATSEQFAVGWKEEVASLRAALRDVKLRIALRLRRLQTLQAKARRVEREPGGDDRQARLLLIEMQSFDERRGLREEQRRVQELRAVLAERREVRLLAPPAVVEVATVSLRQALLTGLVFGLSLSIAWVVANSGRRED